MLGESYQQASIAAVPRAQVDAESRKFYKNMIEENREIFDQAMENMGARYGTKGPQLSIASDEVRDSLKATRESLKKQATKISDQVDYLVKEPNTVDAFEAIAYIEGQIKATPNETT